MGGAASPSLQPIDHSCSYILPTLLFNFPLYHVGLTYFICQDARYKEESAGEVTN